MNDFEKNISDFVKNHPMNVITEDFALKKEYIGIKMYDEPIFAYGSVSDPLFNTLKNKEAIGEHFRLPTEWNESGNTVISLFLPFADEVVISNEKDSDFPSDLWLHGRVEGQEFINDVSRHIEQYFADLGFKAVCPFISKDFQTTSDVKTNVFTSNWSERHVGFVCGMGTFGLCKGIITKKGMAGRLTSVVTQKTYPITNREYKDIYEYCTMCGACIARCPGDAIDLETGKNHILCSNFMTTIRPKTNPRYGCGKCQTAVPCARGIPR